jgi:hypothetical protein
MAIEKKRGCGFRKIGGLYLVCEGFSFYCDRLPIKVESCPVCGGGIHPSLGFTWINPKALFGAHMIEEIMGGHGVGGSNQWTSETRPCGDDDPICKDPPERAGLMWVGSKFYTPEKFIEEVRQMGASKRIPAIPKGFEVGKTWVLLAHRGGFYDAEKGHCPGIFYAFRPSAIEKLVPDDTPAEELEKLKKQGIKPILVPKDDPDHQGTVYEDFKGRRAKKRVEREGESLLSGFFDKKVGVEVRA